MATLRESKPDCGGVDLCYTQGWCSRPDCQRGIGRGRRCATSLGGPEGACPKGSQDATEPGPVAQPSCRSPSLLIRPCGGRAPSGATLSEALVCLWPRTPAGAHPHGSLVLGGGPGVVPPPSASLKWDPRAMGSGRPGGPDLRFSDGLARRPHVGRPALRF